MSEQYTGPKEELNPEIIKRFQLGDIGFTLRVEDGLDTEDVSRIISNSLSPLGLRSFFYDWQKLPDHLQEKLKKNVDAYISSPRHTFESNSMNIFYNCVFREVDNDADPKVQEETTRENRCLAHLIDFWTGGSGFLGPEKRQRYEDLNAKVLVIVAKSQFRRHIRGWTMRDVFTIPVVDWKTD